MRICFTRMTRFYAIGILSPLGICDLPAASQRISDQETWNDEKIGRRNLSHLHHELPRVPVFPGTEGTADRCQ